MKKYCEKYFLVVSEGHSIYIKIECDESITIEEAEKYIKGNYPFAKRITPIDYKKAKHFLQL